MGVAIRITNLTKRYGDVIAVDNQNLHVYEGEFLSLLGPSGCGKTTLLRCIAGLEEPEVGKIVIGEHVVFSSEEGINVPAGKRKVGMVFQSYALWPHMNVYENVGFGLQNDKLPKTEIRKRVDVVLQDLAMDGLGDRYPSELSGGQQQRVALARLLATKPAVFLMDEPLSNLDARLRLDMRSEVKRLHYDSGATTVYVTHDQTEALTMASRVAVMRKGRIVQVDEPREIYVRPGNLFVAEFVGMPRVNLIPGEALPGDDGTLLEFGPFRQTIDAALPKKRFVAAIRPEDIDLSFKPGLGKVEFRVYAVLATGPELFADLRSGDTVVVVRLASNVRLEMDQTVWVSIQPGMLNLYEIESGSLLSAWKSEVSETAGEL